MNKPRFKPLLISLALCLLSACQVELYSDLNMADATELLTVLAENQIEASKERVGEAGWVLKVEQSELSAALSVLKQNGLPKEKLTNLCEASQVQGLVATPAQERMRYLCALQQEIAQTLRQVDGVVSARVHLVLPDNDPLSDKMRPSSAAVFIKHRAEVDLQLLTPTVKDLVAHSMEGLTHDKVSLTWVPMQRSTALIQKASLVGAWSPSADAEEILAPSPRISDAASKTPADNLMTPQVQTVLATLLVAGLCALLALPFLLKRQGLTLRGWLQALKKQPPKRR
jgi:type III secretion protein J